MPLIKTFHNSGRWDRSEDLLARNVRRMRADDRTLGTRTELTTQDHHAELSWPDDGWGVYHPRTTQTGGRVDCAVEWDQSVWRMVETYLLALTDIRITTRNGFELPSSSMPCAVLEHRHTGRHVVLGAFHMALANTPLRQKAWSEEAATIRRHALDVHHEHPGWHLDFQGDGNRNQRLAANRELVRRHMLVGTKLRNCWEGHLPKTGGTHGPRSILDLTVSSMSGGSGLLPDDASSDHRPFETWLTLP